MMSLNSSLRAGGAVLAAVLLASCSGAADPGATPADDPATVTAEEPATTAEATDEPTSASTDSTDAPTTADPTEEMTDDDPTATGPLALSLAETGLGEILVDGDGMTLYLFTNDTQGSGASTCEGQCLVNWPPLVGEPMAGEGVDDSLLGSFTKPDGTVQATYNGWPLYYWVADAAPGDTTGQGVQGVWFVLDSDGNAIGG